MEPAWIAGLAGGVLIGTAAALYLLINGRIMGASGIVGGLVDGSGHDTLGERLAFLVGLVTVPALVVWFGEAAADTHLTPSLAVVVASGVLVGLGTRVGSGCTSGHGVCGMSRLSARSILATFIYIGAGAVTVGLFRHVGGLI